MENMKKIPSSEKIIDSQQTLEEYVSKIYKTLKKIQIKVVQRT